MVYLALLASLLMSAAPFEYRERIAVIDTGASAFMFEQNYMCKSGHLDLTGKGLIDAEGHGSNIVDIISAAVDPNTQCITVIKWFHVLNSKRHIPNELLFRLALAHANSIEAKYINMSLSGGAHFESERRELEIALKRGAIVVVAAGNERTDLSDECNQYPACYPLSEYKNWWIVANYKNGVPTSNSNYGGPVNAKVDGNNVYGGGYCLSGTSQAAALHTAHLLKDNNGTVKH